MDHCDNRKISLSLYYNHLTWFWSDQCTSKLEKKSVLGIRSPIPSTRKTTPKMKKIVYSSCLKQKRQQLQY